MTFPKIFVVPKPTPNSKMRLFCFPFAGGSANTYFSWIDKFSNDVELILIQPPGRGTRFAEQAHCSMDGLVSELMQFAQFFCEKPFILFGHSLGSRVAYDLCCRLQSLNMRLPEYFVASGSGAPHLSDDMEHIHNLPQDLLVKKLEELNGTPQEVLQNSELMELMMPPLRAAFEIADTYLSRKIIMPFPIMVLTGKQDIHVKKYQAEAWGELSNKTCSKVEFPGDHFFINELTDLIIVKLTMLFQQLLTEEQSA